jgi:hypothetical protein
LVSWHCLVRHQAGALNGIAPVFQQIRLSAAVAFQETVGPFSRRGRVLIAGGVVSMRNLLLALLQRGRNSHVDPGFFEGASSVRSDRPSRQRSARDSAPRSLHPRNNSAIRRQKSSSAKRLNACWPDASTHKSHGRDGEKAAMTRYRGLTNYYLGIVYSFRDSITAGWVIFPPRTFRPLAKPGSAANAASTPRLASAYTYGAVAAPKA